MRDFSSSRDDNEARPFSITLSPTPLGPLVSTAAPAPPRTLTLAVRVYDQRSDTTVNLKQAMEEADRVFASIGVALVWAECGASGSGTEPRCARPPAPEERVLRVMDAEVAGDPRHEPMVLGAAFIDPRTKYGAFATIFGRRVNAWADSAGVRRTDALGHAIAHELGHLVLGTTAHSRHGVMRGVWRKDASRGFGVDWAFTEDDAKELRGQLSRRAGGNALETN